MSDRFTDELWQGAADIYGAILAHPFLAGLTDGSLEQDAFTFYVLQDAIYLRSYARRSRPWRAARRTPPGSRCSAATPPR